MRQSTNKLQVHKMLPSDSLTSKATAPSTGAAGDQKSTSKEEEKKQLVWGP